MNYIQQNFEQLIAPVTTKAFYADFFKRQPLLIQRDQPDYFKELLSIESIADYLERKDLIYPSIRVVKDGMELPTSFYVNQSTFGNRTLEKINSRKVFGLLADGATVVGQQMNLSFPSLYALSQNLAQQFQAKLNINGYLTPSASKAFRPHYDMHEIIVIQVYGSKDWKLYDMPVASPNEPFDRAKWTPTAPSHEFTLKQGDTLYLPCGFIHEAISVDEPSLHLSIGLSLHDAELQNKNYVEPRGRLFDVLHYRQLTPDSRLRCSIKPPPTLTEHNDIMTIEFYDTRLTFPLSQKELLLKLITTEEIMIRELPGKFNDPALVQGIRMLIKHGILEIVSIA